MNNIEHHDTRYSMEGLTTIKQISDKTAIKFQEVKENDGETQNV